MINLIPPTIKQTLRARRFNAKLIRWLSGAVLATLLLILIVGAGWLYLDHQNSNLSKDLAATNQQLDAQNLKDVQKQAQTINQNIKIINQVLGSEVRFSDLIQQIGSILPDGAVLKNLTIGKIDGALDLSAGALDYNAATQIAVNLSDPKNNLFDKVDIVNITCPTNPTSDYRCDGTYKALFNKAAKTRFLNAATGGKQ